MGAEIATQLAVGGQDFVDFLQGVTEFVQHGSLRAGAHAGGVPAEAGETSEPLYHADNAGHRWCTECLVSGVALDRRRLREALADFGSSLVIAGGRSRARIHVHVDEPAAVFRIAAEFGVVDGCKADDMHSQQASARAGARTVAIITDSAADLPEELLSALDVHMVPVRIHFGDRSFLDKVSLDTADFYRLMA